MGLTARERRHREFLATITADGRSRLEGIMWAAEMLHVSKWTVAAWLKPETTKSSNAVPEWALELLAFKAKRK